MVSIRPDGVRLADLHLWQGPAAPPGALLGRLDAWLDSLPAGEAEAPQGGGVPGGSSATLRAGGDWAPRGEARHHEGRLPPAWPERLLHRADETPPCAEALQGPPRAGRCRYVQLPAPLRLERVGERDADHRRGAMDGSQVHRGAVSHLPAFDARKQHEAALPDTARADRTGCRRAVPRRQPGRRAIPASRLIAEPLGPYGTWCARPARHQPGATSFGVPTRERQFTCR